MTTGVVGGSGFAPTVIVKPPNPEAARYAKLWENPDYRVSSPGERHAVEFLARLQPKRGAEVIDFGCGTGRGGHALAKMGGMVPILVDFVGNCLDQEIRDAGYRFVKADLTRFVPVSAEYGYCCDVLEHIEPQDVQRVLANILGSAKHVFLNISTIEDNFGDELDGKPLHLTIRTAEWWLEQLQALGAKLFYHRDNGDSLAVYCSSWKEASELIVAGRTNVPEEVIEAQTIANIRNGWTNIRPHVRQEREICLLAGGPSLADSLEMIQELRKEGAGIVTCNGAYGWALEHGLEPGVQIVLDAREFNSRFVRPITGYTKYLMASQVHPQTLKGLPRERAMIWHSGISPKAEEVVREMTGEFFPIPGGSTVTLRALPLLRIMGYYKIHVFGFDSCLSFQGAHHAYPQQENEDEPVIPVLCGGRMFVCTPWQLMQANEFRGVIGLLGEDAELAIHGDGLIAQMVKTGAEFSVKEQ